MIGGAYSGLMAVSRRGDYEVREKTNIYAGRGFSSRDKWLRIGAGTVVYGNQLCLSIGREL